jgi:hypothetical protein
MREGSSGPGLPRRGILRALALAPAALAGCAAGSAAGSAERGGVPAAVGGRAEKPPAAPGAPVPATVAAVRALRLPADAEPAAVLRATAARPGEPR